MDLSVDGALDLRMSSAEARAARGRWTRPGAERMRRRSPRPTTPPGPYGTRRPGALRAFLLLLPLPAAAETVLNRRLSVRRRADLAADLAD
ncbi:hypothetical protein [Streptomyces erythrochromogenes]|uniref:hypothetical protein n=1 Tax=Streptomyces erythrochromogenes TaxID=285574 RepID=UPI0004CCCDC5|nr:hypothetical protein [Streptomyces erythrochromogenes]